MEHLVVHPTTTADWHALVQEAESNCEYHLCEELESYLVFLLMRFTKESHLHGRALAMEWLESQHALLKEKEDKLQTVGDKCLLLAGLFPGRAEQLRVRISYFVTLGQSAYGLLSEQHGPSLATLFMALSEEFVCLMEILQAMRAVSATDEALTPLQAEELWADTQSELAKNCLNSHLTYPDARIDVKLKPSRH